MYFIDFALLTMASKTNGYKEKQDMEVLSISDVYHVDLLSDMNYLQKPDLDSSNPPKMQNLGTMVAIKTRKKNQPEETEWILKPFLAPAPYNSLLFDGREISQIFYHRKTNLVGFTFSFTVEETNKFMIMRLASSTDPNPHTGTLDELGVFLNICSKIRPDLKPIELFNRRYIKKFLTDPVNKLNNAVEIVDKIFLGKEDVTDFSSQYFGELLRPYYRPYVYFMLENHHLNKKAIKKLISSVNNIPALMKSLSWTNELMLYNALCEFLYRHLCHNPECNGFSLFRCGGCDSASYCNVECQEKGSKVHDCEMLLHFKTSREDVPKSLEKMLEICLGKKVSISIHSFSKSLMTKIYRSFFGALQNRCFIYCLQNDFFNFGQGRYPMKIKKCNLKMLDLVKRGRDTQSLSTIRSQLVQTYGKNNKVVRKMRPS